MSQAFPFAFQAKKYFGTYEQKPVAGGSEYRLSIEDKNLMNQLGDCSVIILDKDPEWHLNFSSGSTEQLRAPLIEGLENAIEVWRIGFYLRDAEQIGSVRRTWKNTTPLYSVVYAIKGFSDTPRALDIFPIEGAGFSWGSIDSFPPDIVDPLGAAIETRLSRAGIDIFAQ